MGGGSSCSMNAPSSSEYTSLPLTKSIIKSITKRQGMPRALQNETSFPKAKVRIKNEMTLMR